MARQTIEQNHDWYMRGIEDFTSRLRGLMNICDNKETIIVFADHGEDLGEGGGGGHYAGSHLEELRKVPIWINRKVNIPDNISHLTLKKFVLDMYEKFEKNNPDYQKWRKK
jgi:hypothetical protein